MSLLQDPVKAVDQIEWYILNQKDEKFPGAFLLAAGNLARQTLEQILFILAFYGELPKNLYLKTDGRIINSGLIIKNLKNINPISGKSYYQIARLKGPRIRKFARYPRTLNLWRNIFNEPSHFKNPAVARKTRENHILEFIQRMKSILDDADVNLITAAVNELRSKGTVKAILSNDEKNIPGIEIKVIVSPKDFIIENNALAFKTTESHIHVVPDEKSVPLKWKNRAILVQHSKNIRIQMKLITQHGHPVNISSLKDTICSFLSEVNGKNELQRRFKELNVDIDIEALAGEFA